MSSGCRVAVVNIWRVALAYTDAFVEELPEEDVCMFVHCESLMKWSLPKDDWKRFLQTYENRAEKDALYDPIVDIEDFGYSVRAALKSLRPDVVVFISIDGLFDRWANMVCQDLGIPRLHFMHGVRSAQVARRKRTVKERVRRTLRKVPRGLHYLVSFLLYLRDCAKGELKREAPWLKELWWLLARHDEYRFEPAITYNMKYNVCCVTCEADLEYFERYYGISKASTKMVVVGHADESVLRDGIRARGEDSAVHVGGRRVLFLSSPYVSVGATSPQEYVDTILALESAVERAGGQFEVRPHPRDDLDILRKLEEQEVELSERSLEGDLLDGLAVAAGVRSTVLLAARRIGIPVLTAGLSHSQDATFLRGYDRWLHVPYGELESMRSQVEAFVEDWIGETRPIELDELRDPAGAIAREVGRICHDYCRA